ncbi:hypothetical protein [Marinisporobacter balticus]|uniref:Uncharacterized protein n=1 Tax=Marinisporobacter balticus TaxID=2018667 RepID=A0A4R2KSL9_9FIRM|nr:hypothetical protein [Marinisporobacter balticus]TCO77361.1 hypothetical protein EV214_1063 [Marinisporobacter balticus]
MYNKYSRKIETKTREKNSFKDTPIELLAKVVKDKKIITDEILYTFKYWGKFQEITFKEITILTNFPIVLKDGNGIEIKFRAGFDIINENERRIEKHKYFVYKKELPPSDVIKTNNDMVGFEHIIHNMSIKCIDLEYQQNEKNMEIICKYNIEYRIDYISNEIIEL